MPEVPKAVWESAVALDRCSCGKQLIPGVSTKSAATRSDEPRSTGCKKRNGRGEFLGRSVVEPDLRGQRPASRAHSIRSDRASAPPDSCDFTGSINGRN